MNLVLIDTGSIYHAILNAISIGGKTKKLRPDYEGQIKFNVAYLLSGTYLHQLGFANQSFRCIFLQDCKPYWRHGLLVKEGINYKGNRTTQGWREKSITTIKGIFNSTLSDCNVRPMSLWASNRIDGNIYGYEADDLAAGVIKTIGRDFDNIFLLTVDTDWLPFTNDPRVHWLNTGHHQPRVRKYNEALDYCKNSVVTTKTVDRKNFEWFSPLDLWKFKAEFGDAADNLKGSKNTYDRPDNFFHKYIDLFNPDNNFRCWEEMAFMDIAKICLTQPRPPVPLHIIDECNAGCVYAVPPYENVFSPYGNLSEAFSEALRITTNPHNYGEEDLDPQSLQIARDSLGI